ncbi:hypothetical protein ATANTOWER_014272 [Ataeniobius toweri]|uniref:Small EDRK-rich factor-like N-terminal domain-containing protein n=1 Tax=Ataeniobius toweri TaxID=208326 RepID=A0ABU7AP67_9TELE|nr:hypothetical protein [Ataeniobius toweri]
MSRTQKQSHAQEGSFRKTDPEVRQGEVVGRQKSQRAKASEVSNMGKAEQKNLRSKDKIRQGRKDCWTLLTQRLSIIWRCLSVSVMLTKPGSGAGPRTFNYPADYLYPVPPFFMVPFPEDCTPMLNVLLPSLHQQLSPDDPSSHPIHPSPRPLPSKNLICLWRGYC